MATFSFPSFEIDTHSEGTHKHRNDHHEGQEDENEEEKTKDTEDRDAFGVHRGHRAYDGRQPEGGPPGFGSDGGGGGGIHGHTGGILPNHRRQTRKTETPRTNGR